MSLELASSYFKKEEMTRGDCVGYGVKLVEE